MRQKEFKLWNEEWECKESKSIIYEIFLSNQMTMKQFVRQLYETQQKSCVFKKTGNSYNMTISVNPWIYENFRDVRNIFLFLTKDRISGILEAHNVRLNLSWNEIGNPYFRKIAEIEKIFGEFTSKVFANSAQSYVNNFKQLYDNELNNSQGLGFGIISNSIASHLIYASMSVKNDMRNRAKASMNAQEIAGEPSEAISIDLAEQGGRFYNDYIQDMIVNLVTEYFIYVEEIITKALGENWEELSTLWNEHSYKAIDYTSKKDVLSALKINSINVGALAYSIYYWGDDRELIDFCKQNSPIVLEALNEEMISFCIEVNSRANRKVYNKLIVDDDNCLYWDNLKKAYKKIYTKDYPEKWEELISSVYEEVNSIQAYLKTLQSWNQQGEIEKHFEDIDTVNKEKQYYLNFLGSDRFKTLEILYNKLEVPSIRNIVSEIYLYQVNVLSEDNFKECMDRKFEYIKRLIEYRINTEQEYRDLIRAIAIEKEELGKMWYARWGSAAKRKKELEETIRKNEEKRDEIFKKNDFLYRKIF